MKIQIKSLRAVNCGPLRDVFIDFTTNGEPRPITLLAGAKGSGKTTVLELIFSLMSRLQSTETTRDERPAFHIADYVRLDLFVDSEPVSIIKGTSADGEIPPRNVVRFPSVNEGHTTHIEGETAWKLRNAIVEQSGRPLDDPKSRFEAGSIVYFPHWRETHGYVGREVSRFEVAYAWPIRYNPATRYEQSLDSYLIWLDYADPEQFARTIHFLTSLDFDGKKFSVSRKSLKAVVTTPEGGTHGVSELSAGEQNLIELLLDLYRRLLPHSIVLIDEIENSLHTAFQHKLGTALKKMQQEIPFQLMATSHSREFLKIFGPENTLILTEF